MLLSLPICKAWGRYLPKYSFFGISLNPGPFTIKEHVIITVMAAVYCRGRCYRSCGSWERFVILDTEMGVKFLFGSLKVNAGIQIVATVRKKATVACAWDDLACPRHPRSGPEAPERQVRLSYYVRRWYRCRGCRLDATSEPSLHRRHWNSLGSTHSDRWEGTRRTKFVSFLIDL
jgi:hypothetical protein